MPFACLLQKKTGFRTKMFPMGRTSNVLECMPHRYPEILILCRFTVQQMLISVLKEKNDYSYG